MIKYNNNLTLLQNATVKKIKSVLQYGLWFYSPKCFVTTVKELRKLLYVLLNELAGNLSAI